MARPKLTVAQAAELRAIYFARNGLSLAAVARLFRVSEPTAAAVVEQRGAYRPGRLPLLPEDPGPVAAPWPADGGD